MHAERCVTSLCANTSAHKLILFFNAKTAKPPTPSHLLVTSQIHKAEGATQLLCQPRPFCLPQARHPLLYCDAQNGVAAAAAVVLVVVRRAPHFSTTALSAAGASPLQGG
jgi:hypothetical protein